MVMRVWLEGSGPDTASEVDVETGEVFLAGLDAPLRVEPAGDGRLAVTHGATRTTAATTAAVIVREDRVWVQIGVDVFEFHVGRGTRRHGAARDLQALTPPMSATVVRVAVAPGTAVKQGDLLIALEAMKMELPIRAPHDGVVSAVHCREGELVQPGTLLIEL